MERGCEPAPFVGEVGRGGVGDDTAPGDEDDARGDLLRFFEDVGREQHRLVPRRLREQRADMAPLGGVEAVGGLVEDQHRRIVQERLCEPGPLAPAFRELAHRHVARFVRMDVLDDAIDGIFERAAGEPARFPAEPEELADGETGESGRRLGQESDGGRGGPPLGDHVVTADPRAAFRGAQDAGEQPHGGRLAGAVASEERAQLATPDPERQPVHHRPPSETHREPERFDHRASRHVVLPAPLRQLVVRFGVDGVGDAHRPAAKHYRPQGIDADRAD